MSYLRVLEDAESAPVELELESDKSLLLSTLQAQFPHAIGLKYLPDADSDIYRGIRCVEDRLRPPREGWSGLTLYCTFPPDYKRKGEEGEDDGPPTKRHHSGRDKCVDLIVLGLNFATTDESLREAFEEKFGPLLMALVKRDISTNRSKGFGFIRFAKYEDQVKALSSRRHEIEGRWVTIKPPYAKAGVESSLPSKVFISRLTPDMTKEDLRDYFCKYGEITDIFYPTSPTFRGFAFLTFLAIDAAERACDEDPHIIKNVSVSVVPATDQKKKPDNYRGGRGNNSNYRGDDYGRGNYNDYPGNYGRRDDYGRGGGGPQDIGKILAAALNNPNTISSLLNNLGGGNKGGGNMDDRASPSGKRMDYPGRKSDEPYDNRGGYSYSDQKYNNDNKDYGPGKYGGGYSPFNRH